MALLNVKRCPGCNAMIAWLVTESGARMPCNADTPEKRAALVNSTRYDKERHESHFATCSKASDYRKSRR